MRGFAQADRFLSELESHKLKPAYVLVGDEAFFRKRCREAILEHLVAPDSRDFSFFEFDLSETSLGEILDRARTPSLMAPFQVFFVRGVKALFGRGSNDEKIGAISDYCKNPNPDALLVFVADHISIPADARRMEMTDKVRYQKIREDLGPICGIVELARVEEGEAVRWIGEYCATRDVKIDADGARELVDALGGDMMTISNELEKLILYVGEKKKISLGDVETMVLSAKQRSLYELTDAISRAGDTGRDPLQRRRRRSSHRPSVHAGQDLSADAGDPGTQRARSANAVGGAMAGFPRASFCGRRHHPTGPPLQVQA
jgi:DNA polymerase-3 subunit delta